MKRKRETKIRGRKRNGVTGRKEVRGESISTVLHDAEFEECIPTPVYDAQ